VSEPSDRITPAQARVLEALVFDGAANEVLAARLGLATSTVKFHLFNAFRVSGCGTRTGLALWWIRSGRYESWNGSS